MTETLVSTKQEPKSEWFDNFVAELRVHELALETNTASEEVRSFYETIFSGNVDSMALMNKLHIQKHFIGKIIVDYVKIIQQNFPLKLAFDYNDSEVLVWAEIPNDDEVIERNLIMAEAKINAKYHDFGYDMTTTLVETRDQLSVPNHYQIFID
ncbi:MAG: hypothetical protein MUF58_19305 [Arcicella sp.]|jgi:hypothetical protein|nr:hypothetical protein [Arcicella sp.]